MSSVGPGGWPCLAAGSVRGTRRGGSKPEHDPGRLHGLVHDRQQLAAEGVEVDLVAQAGGERLDGLDGVVLAAVEAPVHDLLDAAAGRLEQGGHGQGRTTTVTRGRPRRTLPAGGSLEVVGTSGRYTTRAWTHGALASALVVRAQSEAQAP
jgi:hypothetical protein